MAGNRKFAVISGVSGRRKPKRTPSPCMDLDDISSDSFGGEASPHDFKLTLSYDTEDSVTPVGSIVFSSDEDALNFGQEDRRKVRKCDPRPMKQPRPTDVPAYEPTPRERPTNVPAYEPTPVDLTSGHNRRQENGRSTSRHMNRRQGKGRSTSRHMNRRQENGRPTPRHMNRCQEKGRSTSQGINRRQEKGRPMARKMFP